MKKTITLITVLIFTLSFFNCKAQTPIKSIDSLGWDNLNNAYYKDLNNQLNDFEGTWLYTNGTTSLKIVLEKKLMIYNGEYYEDLIVGEYQYIENGVEKINTLSQLNQDLGENHNIYGNFLDDNCTYSSIDDCIDGEIRLGLAMVDPLIQSVSELTLHKRVINGQQALKAWYCWCAGAITVQEGEAGSPEPTIGTQLENIVFIKQ
ncbi:DUF6705 family protein [Winogradskyella wichelsiae]|uniref:DUF6705 family protein n=1 Tax=Winogradskyella wichelsiae TaxID=2697007 RepID=UPI0015CA6C37|nr:DUF6705 family protein [Winogradskyella wichelsiae]